MCLATRRLRHFSFSTKPGTHPTRVYSAGSVGVTIQNDEATSAEAKAGADRPVALLGIEPDAAAANYRDAIADINTLATNIVPGGALKFASASSRTVTMTETFPRPLVVGYIGFDLPILAGGRVGTPISTLAQLTGQQTVPAAQVDTVLRAASLNHVYRMLRAVNGSEARSAQAKLDALAAELPARYTFTLWERPDSNSIRKNTDSSHPVEGQSAARNRFTDVTDLMTSAETTVETLEFALARPDLRGDADQSAMLREELEKAQAAHDLAAEVLRDGSAPLMAAVDLVLFGN